MAGEQKQRGSYVAGTVTRESILEVAMRLIAEKGYYGFSLRDVARMVGISHPAVIYHFPSKEILLMAAAQRCELMMGLLQVELDIEQGAIDEKGIIPESIGGLGLALMRLSKVPDYRVLVNLDLALSIEAGQEDHPLHDHYVYKFNTLNAFVTKELAEEEAKGTITLPMSAVAAARRLIATWYGSGAAERYLAPDESGPDSVAVYLASVSRFLQLESDTILSIAVGIPEDLADVFQRVIKTNQRLNR